MRSPDAKKVSVRVFAKQYENARPLADAEITDLATGETWRTGRDGYATLSVRPGRRLSLAFNKASYPAVQTATVTVPENGLTDRGSEITLQVPGKKLYKLLRAALGRPKPGKRHLVTTVSAFGKDLHDDMGEAGVTVTLRDAASGRERRDAIYLGTAFGKTEWLRPVAAERVPGLKKLRHKSTSHDGGAIFKNVPPGEYIIEASKTGPDGKPVVFTSAAVTVFENSPELVNLSPPHGPRVATAPPSPRRR